MQIKGINKSYNSRLIFKPPGVKQEYSFDYPNKHCTLYMNIQIFVVFVLFPFFFESLLSRYSDTVQVSPELNFVLYRVLVHMG